jgi:apolipoprotein N-acyltransferase
LQWPGLALVLRALDGLSLRRAALVGWCAGLGAHVALFTWLATATARLGELHPAAAALAFAAWASFASLQLALVGALDACARAAAPAARRVLFACAFVTAELVWPQVIPWTIGLPQQQASSLAQVAELGGAALLTFVVVFGATGLDAALDLARARPLPRRAIIDVSCAAAVLVVALSLGAWRLSVARAPAQRSARVAIVQPGVVSNRLTARTPREVQAALERLAREVGAAGGVELAVFPESAAARPIIDNTPDEADVALRAEANGALADLARVARRCGCHTLVGATAVRVEPASRKVVERRNVVLLLDAQGAVLDRYEKHALLAVAEHLPGETALPWLRALVPFAGRFTAGPGPRVLRAGALSLAPLICFEAVPGAPAREALARGDVDLLVNATNDVWFGDGQGPHLHALAASLRAIETRRALLRSTTTGLSFAVLPDGTRVAETPLSQATLRIVDVPLPDVPGARTLHARGGHLFAPAAALVMGVLLLARLGSARGQRPLANPPGHVSTS